MRVKRLKVQRELIHTVSLVEFVVVSCLWLRSVRSGSYCVRIGPLRLLLCWFWFVVVRAVFVVLRCGPCWVPYGSCSVCSASFCFVLLRVMFVLVRFLFRSGSRCVRSSYQTCVTAGDESS